MSAFKTLKPSTLSREEFVAAFADIYEHSPWVAEKAYDLGLDASVDQIDTLHQRMSDLLLSADHDRQLALINAHPDLAGKAAATNASRLRVEGLRVLKVLIGRSLQQKGGWRASAGR